MLQSSMSNAESNAKGSLPQKGHRIRDYELREAEDRLFEFSGLRGKKNLLLIFAGTRDNGEQQVSKFLPFEDELLEDETKVVIVIAEGSAWITGSDAILVVTDKDGMAHEEVGAKVGSRYEPACYITDRFGEVFAEYRSREGTPLPPPDECLRWLDFINSQCPECEPPEWPA